ncbi:dioxygenase family protein [Granulicoccus phenolivorans]|uniref:dioxygenase family protein n=1 Tax=Granulicoccus phenolivorans TaxID=266854 RepID=UPI0004078C22|nr:class III extradiol ring-cleavage dioxygenase [Granulicoccus phenolivorans]
MTTQPVLFLSHGAPPLADDALWTRQLADWSATLPKPTNILMISAHWEARPLTVSPSQHKVPLTYDFWGFPDKYYTVTYDAPLAPELAASVDALVAEAGHGVRRDEERGLDHGAYVPLVEMYPDADVPVLQLSMPTLDPRTLFELGKKLSALRDEGTLIIGSGFTTHNLRMAPMWDFTAPAPTWSAEFDQWAAEAMAAQDLDALLNFDTVAPAAKLAHPRTEHWAPLYVALGAAAGKDSLANTSVIDGFWVGLSKRSWQFA